ncbi:Aste57867_11086 [Aphanomyces stellatus]|uniref:Branched-chain-amino-acid aminotransferase n=1 Tax=Aphanomyces stellatus TaxID=120398 RepID=A0A485KSJ3_9STRA|nr:hypothetical protein As57867_011044 [Aphanomyces stellatus]VFT87953.1 Aste57867_11086 [Aphanomyces stellatus]
MFVARRLQSLKINQLAQGSKAFSAIAGIDSTKTRINKTSNPKAKTPKEKLTFGTTFSDHLLEIDWDQKTGWAPPLIRPYGPLAVDPASSSLHYALQCFEGMKAYIDDKGKIRLFRPDMNMKRMNTSMERLFLPTFDSDELIKCINQLILLDQSWIPEGDGYSLYIRPTGISTHPFIGVGASSKAKVFVIVSPVGPYYPEGFNPVKLFADDTYVRAWPGGTGSNKVGGNYGATIMPQMEAAKKGYSQILWLFGEDHYVTEVGTMNLFVHWINEKGEKELVTPPLARGDILPGVTRDSILELTENWGEFTVKEHTIKMADIVKAHKDGRLLEIFGSGTAAIISPVGLINYNGKDINVPLDAPDGKSGKIAKRLWKEITDIQYGRVEHPWSVVIN